MTMQSAGRGAVMAVLLMAIAGCTSIYRNHGYSPTEEDLAEVVVGVDTRDSVIDTLGPPSASGVLNDQGLFYVSSRVRHFGAFAPEVVEREVVAITFATSGAVQNIERFGLEDGQVVPLARRATTSGIRDTTFIRQLLGNLGRIAPGSFDN